MPKIPERDPGEPTFASELPPREGVLEHQEASPAAGRRARLDRADKALARVAGTMAVITARHEGQVASGMLATLATASQDPPRISLALSHHHPVLALIRVQETFAINLLGAHQEAYARSLCGAHAGASSALDGVEYQNGVWSGAPILTGALAFLEGRMVASLDAGDHVVLVADILDGGTLRDGDPLIWSGAYRPTTKLSKLDIH